MTDVLGIEDHGINQNTWAGLQEAKANGDVDQVEYIESIDTRDYEKNIAYFAEKGYDVIVTLGLGLRDQTLHSADLYPDSVFVGIISPVTSSPEDPFPSPSPKTKWDSSLGHWRRVFQKLISSAQYARKLGH